MEILMTIGLVILGIIILIGIIRVIFAPYTGFVNFLMELMLLDWLGDCLGWVFESIGDIWDND
jgi:hypothetical protein